MTSKLALFLLSASVSFAGFDANFVDFVPPNGNTPLSASFRWNGDDITVNGGDNLPGDQGIGSFTGETMNGSDVLTVTLKLADLGNDYTSVPFELIFDNSSDGFTYGSSFEVTVYGFSSVNPQVLISGINILGANGLNEGNFTGSYNVNSTSLTFSSTGGFNVPSGQSNLFAEFTTSTSAIPEPSTVALGFGMAAAGFAAWRRRKQKS